MITRYADFLKIFDEKLKNLFDKHQKYIQCKKGCSVCCEKGQYPMSQLEFLYLTQGFINLDNETKITVQQNIKTLINEKKKFKGKKFEHICPFLINKECCVYPYRGIICRTFGLCYYDEENKYVRIPDCVNFGLNYFQYYDKKSKTLNIADVPQINLRIDKVFESESAKTFKLNCGEIRPLIEWFEQK